MILSLFGFEGWPGDWVNHLVNGHRTLVLDFRHVVDLYRLLPGWGAVAGVRSGVFPRVGGGALERKRAVGEAARGSAVEGVVARGTEGGG